MKRVLAASAASSVAVTMSLAGTAFADFETAQVWEDTSLLRPAFSTSGDLVGDERPELVVTDYGDYQVEGSEPILAPGAMYIFTNNAEAGTHGEAGLNDWERITVFDESAGIIFPSQPLLADIDGDGDTDILHGGGFFWDSDAGRSRGTLTWWENVEGDGRTWERHSLVEDSPWAYHNVQFADLDGDGHDDVVTVGEQGFTKETYEDDQTQLQFFKGNGDGTFEPVVALADRGGSSPVVFDVDGDGDLDVVSAQYFHVNPLVAEDAPPLPPGDGSFVWFENTSDGTAPLSAADFVQHEISRGQGPAFGIYPVENFYGDGVTRYLGVNHTNTTEGTPGPPIQWLADPNAFVLTPGDDVTEPWDVVELADSYDEGAQWAGEPRGGQAAPGKAAFGDFDGDGDLDVVISGDGDFRAMLVEQVSPGVFHQSVLPGSEGWGQAGVTVNDFDGNGTLEIALSSFENQQTGMWTIADLVDEPVTPEPVAPGDDDGDDGGDAPGGDADDDRAGTNPNRTGVELPGGILAETGSDPAPTAALAALMLAAGAALLAVTRRRAGADSA